MIDVEVQKRLGDFLLDVEFEDEGFVCFGGANGSGKTTLLNVIAGVIQPDHGHVKINGTDLTKLSMEKRGVVMISPDSYIPHLDVDSHVRWGAKVKGIQVSKTQVDEVKALLGISFAGRVNQLSLGMRERVSLATALISQPKVVLVDEAFSSISKREEFIRAYRTLCKNARIDVVFTIQSTDINEEDVDHLYRMETGRATKIF